MDCEDGDTITLREELAGVLEPGRELEGDEIHAPPELRVASDFGAH